MHCHQPLQQLLRHVLPVHPGHAHVIGLADSHLLPGQLCAVVKVDVPVLVLLHHMAVGADIDGVLRDLHDIAGAGAVPAPAQAVVEMHQRRTHVLQRPLHVLALRDASVIDIGRSQYAVSAVVDHALPYELLDIIRGGHHHQRLLHSLQAVAVLGHIAEGIAARLVQLHIGIVYPYGFCQISVHIVAGRHRLPVVRPASGNEIEIADSREGRRRVHDDPQLPGGLVPGPVSGADLQRVFPCAVEADFLQGIPLLQEEAFRLPVRIPQARNHIRCGIVPFRGQIDLVIPPQDLRRHCVLNDDSVDELLPSVVHHRFIGARLRLVHLRQVQLAQMDGPVRAGEIVRDVPAHRVPVFVSLLSKCRFHPIDIEIKIQPSCCQQKQSRQKDSLSAAPALHVLAPQLSLPHPLSILTRPPRDLFPKLPCSQPHHHT